MHNNNLTLNELKVKLKSDQKFNDYLKQRKKRCPELFDGSLKENYDYLVCPITGIHYTKHSARYCKIIGISKDRLLELIPDYQWTAPVVIDKTKEKFNEIDPETRLTVHQKAHKKAMETLNSIDPETGKRRYDMLGEKTKESHLKKVDENGMNGYQRIAKNAIHTGNKTKAEKYKNRKSSEISERDRYENIIDYFTYKCDTSLYTKGVEIKTRRDGGEACNQIDHMFSIVQGFNNKISPIAIAMPENTRIIACKLNESKNDKSCISKKELFKLTNYSEDQSDIEFWLFEELTKKYIKENKFNSALDYLIDILNYLNKTNDPRFDNSISFIKYMINKNNYK